jgi:uncharacterized membrane protein YccC
MKQTTQLLTSVAAITRERFYQKLWRTLVGVGIGVALYLLELDPGLEKWGWIAVGVLVAGEWVLLPVRLLASLVKDAIAPAIVALKQALKS